MGERRRGRLLTRRLNGIRRIRRNPARCHGTNLLALRRDGCHSVPVPDFSALITAVAFTFEARCYAPLGTR